MIDTVTMCECGSGGTSLAMRDGVCSFCRAVRAAEDDETLDVAEKEARYWLESARSYGDLGGFVMRRNHLALVERRRQALAGKRLLDEVSHDRH